MTVGLYVLALQIVLSALLISAIDDLSGGPAFLRHPVGRGTGELHEISARPISFSRALVEFYSRPFSPIFLFGFGLGASLSAFVVGAFQETSLVHDLALKSLGIHRSEAVLGAVLVLGAALMWWRGGRAALIWLRGGLGYFGWVIGVSLAIAIGQIAFVPYTSVRQTVVGWGGLMIGLCLLRLIVLGMAWLRHRGSSPDQPHHGHTEPGAHYDPAATSPPGQTAHHGESS
jgi:hypothetical protein